VEISILYANRRDGPAFILSMIIFHSGAALLGSCFFNQIYIFGTFFKKLFYIGHAKFGFRTITACYVCLLDLYETILELLTFAGGVVVLTFRQVVVTRIVHIAYWIEIHLAWQLRNVKLINTFIASCRERGQFVRLNVA